MHDEPHGQDLGAHLHRVDARENWFKLLLNMMINEHYICDDDDDTFLHCADAFENWHQLLLNMMMMMMMMIMIMIMVDGEDINDADGDAFENW